MDIIAAKSSLVDNGMPHLPPARPASVPRPPPPSPTTARHHPGRPRWPGAPWKAERERPACLSALSSPEPSSRRYWDGRGAAPGAAQDPPVGFHEDMAIIA